MATKKQIAYKTPAQWERAGTKLVSEREHLRQSTAQYQIKVGRWAAFGLAQWDRAAKKKLAALGFEPSTIENWASVARNIPDKLLTKKYALLTFNDFRALAPLPDDAARIEFANAKLANDWSGRELERQITDWRNARGLIQKRDRSNGQHAFNADVASVMLNLKNSNNNNWRGLVAELQNIENALRQSNDAFAIAQADAYNDCIRRIQGYKLTAV